MENATEFARPIEFDITPVSQHISKDVYQYQILPSLSCRFPYNLVPIINFIPSSAALNLLLLSQFCTALSILMQPSQQSLVYYTIKIFSTLRKTQSFSRKKLYLRNRSYPSAPTMLLLNCELRIIMVDGNTLRQMN